MQYIPRFRRLDSSGFDHVMVPLACFVVFALIGSYYLFQSLAATPTTQWKGLLEAYSDSSGYCLSASGTATGSAVVLDPCSKTYTASQVWSLQDTTQATVNSTASVQAFGLRSASGTDECMTNPSATKASYPAKLEPCSTTASTDTWFWGTKFTSKGYSSHQLMNLFATSLCVDDKGGSDASGTAVGLYACKTTSQSNQEWFEQGAPGSGSTTSSAEHIMATLYADPGVAAWTQLENAAPIVKYSIVDICAPDGTGSGCGKPADEKNPSWTSTISALKSKGITPLYYISTNYGAVALTTLESELKDSISWYGIANPMFDEMADSGNCSNGSSSLPCTTYYKDLYNYTVSSGASTVVFNPGTTTPSSYMFGTKEILMIFEGTASNFENTTFPSWMSHYAKGQFVAVLSVGSAATIGNNINHAVKSNIGNIYEDDGV